MVLRRRLAALTAAALALTALVAGAAASAGGPRAEKLRLPAELGRPSEVIAYGRSKLLLVDPYTDAGLIRIDNDGSLDPSFGDGGKVDAPYSGAAVAPDGKVLLAGSGDGDAEVTRLLPDGRPDPSFGRDGTVLIDFGGAYDWGTSVAVAPNGDIVVGGAKQTLVDSRGSSDARAAIGRLLPDGTLDRSFASGGTRTLEGGWESAVSNVVPLRGGGIVATGPAYLGIAVWKLTATGRMNRRFGQNGTINLEDGRGRRENYGWSEELSWVNEVAPLPSGKLLLAATGERYVEHESRYRALALRLKANGKIDRSFGRRGWAAATFGGTTFARNLVLLPHGTLVLVANAQFHHDRESDLGAVAFDSHGKIYRGFGNRGKVRVNLHHWDLVEDATTQGSRLVILGNDRKGERWLVGVPNL
jgi:uncharacterized delta-60 repeat protein